VSANASQTVSVCVGVIGDTNVTAVVVASSCTASGPAIDCVLLRCRPQREFLRRDAMGIPQREEEPPKAVIALTLPAAV
jgi:hypothetical protein